MLQFPSSVETKTSWAVASVALFVLGMSYGARLDYRGGAQGHRQRGGRVTFRSGARQFAGVARLRYRRHHDGPNRQSHRYALDGHVRRVDDRPWPLDFDARAALAAVDRPRSVHRPDRDRRHQCTLVRLCQPLVRPPARLGAGADLERNLSRRCGVAAGVRAAIASFGWRQTMLWYALAEIVVIVPLAAIYFREPPEVIHPAAADWRRFGSSARPRLVAQCGIRDNLRCRRAVLHSDGDAAGPSGRLLQRSRNQPVDERPDAVGAARHRVPEPASLGFDLRPHRRSRDRADRIGMAGHVDDGLSVDAE